MDFNKAKDIINHQNDYMFIFKNNSIIVDDGLNAMMILAPDQKSAIIQAKRIFESNNRWLNRPQDFNIDNFEIKQYSLNNHHSFLILNNDDYDQYAITIKSVKDAINKGSDLNTNNSYKAVYNQPIIFNVIEEAVDGDTSTLYSTTDLANLITFLQDLQAGNTSAIILDSKNPLDNYYVEVWKFDYTDKRYHCDNHVFRAKYKINNDAVIPLITHIKDIIDKD